MVTFVGERAARTRGFLTNVRGFGQVSSLLGPKQSSDLSKTYEAGVAARHKNESGQLRASKIFGKMSGLPESSALFQNKCYFSGA